MVAGRAAREHRLTAAFTAVMVGLGIASPGLAAERTLRFGHMWPPESGRGRAFQRFADPVEEQTDRRYEVQVFPHGQLGKERELFEKLQLGDSTSPSAGPAC